MYALAVALELMTACGTQLPTQLPPLAGRRSIAMSVDTTGVASAIGMPADSAWALLPAIYQELGLPVHERDEKSRRQAACWIRVRGRLGKTPLSRLIDCGELRSVPNADRLQVELLVLTSVRQESHGGTTVSTFVLGTAGESAGSANRVWCLSTGGLETRIREALERSG
ncbi:MAG TPA: hypothetical protein VFO95_15655 [Gemmatimonadales bacterium]|nr:hypothetical protein [Gemmatimonadales bacterium]